MKKGKHVPVYIILNRANNAHNTGEYDIMSVAPGAQIVIENWLEKGADFLDIELYEANEIPWAFSREDDGLYTVSFAGVETKEQNDE